MLLVLKPTDPKASVYLYAPYIPVTVYPWPMSTIPSVTFMSRYAKALIRPQGLAILNIAE